MTPNKWELWFAYVKFEDDPYKLKERPVLILDNNTAYILSAFITSHIPRSNYFGEYAIKEWKAAGLKKASTIRLSKRLPLVEEDLIYKIGKLHPIDILSVQRILLNLF